MNRVELFFDCSSPWTYLGFEALCAAAREDGFGVCFRPFLVGGVFNSINPSVYAARADPVPAKARYMAKDIADWARHYTLAIKWTPSVFPVNSARAMRACLIASDASACEAFARAVFRLYWTEDRDISRPEVLAEACLAAALDPVATLEAADAPETRALLRANTDELMTRGGFGSPTFFVPDAGGDDMYFGQDRVPLVRAAVAR